jgi:hypothetical protein
VKPLLLEEAAHLAHDPAAEQKHPPRLLADDEIDVPLAVALLDIGEAVPLARNGPERFRENPQVGKAHGLFARLGGEEGPLPADEIADVEELPEGELVAESLHLRVDLQLAGFVLDVGEDVLAHLALGDEATRPPARAARRRRSRSPGGTFRCRGKASPNGSMPISRQVSSRARRRASSSLSSSIERWSVGVFPH